MVVVHRVGVVSSGGSGLDGVGVGATFCDLR